MDPDEARLQELIRRNPQREDETERDYARRIWAIFEPPRATAPGRVSPIPTAPTLNVLAKVIRARMAIDYERHQAEAADPSRLSLSEQLLRDVSIRQNRAIVADIAREAEERHAARQSTPTRPGTPQDAMREAILEAERIEREAEERWRARQESRLPDTNEFWETPPAQGPTVDFNIRLEVIHPRDLNSRALHVSRELFTGVANPDSGEHVYNVPLGSRTNTLQLNYGVFGAGLLMGMSPIPGIVKLTLHNNYRLDIRKADPFSWESLGPVVLESAKQIWLRAFKSEPTIAPLTDSPAAGGPTATDEPMRRLDF